MIDMIDAALRRLAYPENEIGDRIGVAVSTLLNETVRRESCRRFTWRHLRGSLPTFWVKGDLPAATGLGNYVFIHSGGKFNSGSQVRPFAH